jgi:hypothetical protein
MSYLLALCAAIICAGIVFAAYSLDDWGYCLDDWQCENCGATGEIDGAECRECKGEGGL